MDQLDFLAPVPAARAEPPKARPTDPPTSHAAAAAVIRATATITAVKAGVLELFRAHGPMADHEWIPKYFRRAAERDVPPHSESGLRTRRSELVDDGFLIDTGTTRPTLGGHAAAVWALTSTATKAR